MGAAIAEATKGAATAEATKGATNIEEVKVEVMAVGVTAGAVIIIKVATTVSTEDSHATAITATEAAVDVVVTTMVNVDNEPEVKAAEEIGGIKKIRSIQLASIHVKIHTRSNINPPRLIKLSQQKAKKLKKTHDENIKEEKMMKGK